MALAKIWRESGNIFGGNYSFYGHDLAAGLQVTFGVWPVFQGHRAGVVWTTDRWASTHWTEAKWSNNTPNFFGGLDETWDAEIDWTIEKGGRFWYALWVEDSEGFRHWDNNRGWNYETAYQ